MDDPTATHPDDDNLSRLDIQVATIRSPRCSWRFGNRREGLSCPPRFGTAHLLLWVTMVSVYFGLARGLLEDQAIGLGGVLILLTQAGIVGAAWSGLCITISRAWRGLNLPIEPGQWLLVILGARLVLEVFVRLKLGELFLTPAAVVSAGTCCLLVIPTASRRLDVSWKVLFAGLVLLYCSPLLLAGLHAWFDYRANGLTEFVTWFKLGASLLMPLLLAGWMWSRKMHLQWLNWVGIAVWSLWVLIQPQILEMAVH